MSFPRLLVFLLVLCSVSFAENQPRPAEKPLINNKPDTAYFFTRTQPPTTYNFSLNGRDLRSFAIQNPETATTCYTMRTYVADHRFDKEFVIKPGTPEGVSYTPPVRNDFQVDTPLNDSYTTCQPSSQFAVKKAIQTVESGNDGK
jgi:hypothetical protein